jgi:quinol monooxygenase YgiN
MERSIRFVVEFTINDGKREAVKQLLTPLIEMVEAKDSGALSYEFFFNKDESKFYVLEWYKDSEAALNHMGIVKEYLSKLLEVSQVTRFEIFGNASEKLVEGLTPLGAQFFTHWGGFTRQ